jgi:twitching motility protein PilT
LSLAPGAAIERDREKSARLKPRSGPDDGRTMAFDLDAALGNTLRIGASDLHVKVGTAPRIRVSGRLVELPGSSPVSPEEAAAVQRQVITSEPKRSELDRNGSADASYYNGEGRFRTSAFTQRGLPSFVFRAVPEAPPADELGLPESVIGWAEAKRGLAVVTGPTGSGKSTTCAAIVDLVNRTRDCHVLTIEDPIEFLHSDQRAIVCQREIGLDAPSYHVALRAAMRQDPDVIMIGEVRDEETAMTALRAAETGHLVLCTMHTIDASEAVQRLVDLFGEQRGPLARQMLSGTLVGICSQRLVPAARGRHGAERRGAHQLFPGAGPDHRAGVARKRCRLGSVQVESGVYRGCQVSLLGREQNADLAAEDAGGDGHDVVAGDDASGAQAIGESDREFSR